MLLNIFTWIESIGLDWMDGWTNRPWSLSNIDQFYIHKIVLINDGRNVLLYFSSASLNWLLICQRYIFRFRDNSSTLYYTFFLSRDP